MVKWLLIVVCMALLGACGGGSDDSADQTVLVDVQQPDLSGSEMPDQSVTPTNEKFNVSWQASNRINFTDPPKLLWTDQDGSSRNEWGANIDCAKGCTVASNQKAIVQVTAQGATGSTIKLWQLNNWAPAGGTEISKNALAWRFDDIALYFVEKEGAEFKFYQVIISTPGQKTFAGTFTAPGGEDSYRGSFVARANQIVVLYTTLGGIELHHLALAKVADGFQKLEPTVGAEQGTGSQLTESEPIAISPNGNEVVLFTRLQGELKIWLWPLTGGNPKNITLSLKQLDACGSDPSDYYQIRKTIWSADSQTIYFLTTSRDNLSTTEGCSDYTSADYKCITNPVTKPESDILSIARTLSPTSVSNITKNPKNDSVDNLVIDDFAISPQGGYLVFIATPKLGGNCRSHNDKEIWKVSTGGQALTMLSDDPGWMPLNGTLLVK